MSGGLGRHLGCQLLPLASPGFAEVAGVRVAGGLLSPLGFGAWVGAEDRRTLLLPYLPQPC